MDSELQKTLDAITQKFEVDFEPLDVDGSALYILSVRNMPQHLDRLLTTQSLKNPLKDLPLWAKVWPAALVLGRFLRHLAPQGKSLLEIGAGCGVTGCIASRYGFASVCVSDIVEDALLFARANVLRNALPVDVRRIDITTARLTTRFDCIAAAEVLYLDELHRPLIKFLLRHLAPGGKAVVCTDMARHKPRFFKLAARDFTLSESRVGVRSADANGAEERRVYALYTLEPK